MKSWNDALAKLAAETVKGRARPALRLDAQSVLKPLRIGVVAGMLLSSSLIGSALNESRMGPQLPAVDLSLTDFGNHCGDNVPECGQSKRYLADSGKAFIASLQFASDISVMNGAAFVPVVHFPRGGAASSGVQAGDVLGRHSTSSSSSGGGGAGILQGGGLNERQLLALTAMPASVYPPAQAGGAVYPSVSTGSQACNGTVNAGSGKCVENTGNGGTVNNASSSAGNSDNGRSGGGNGEIVGGGGSVPQVNEFVALPAIVSETPTVLTTPTNSEPIQTRDLTTTIVVQAVPEPASLVLFALGLAFLGVIVRKKRSK